MKLLSDLIPILHSRPTASRSAAYHRSDCHWSEMMLLLEARVTSKILEVKRRVSSTFHLYFSTARTRSRSRGFWIQPSENGCRSREGCYALRKSCYRLLEGSYHLLESSYRLLEDSYVLLKSSYPLPDSSYALLENSYRLLHGCYHLLDDSYAGRKDRARRSSLLYGQLRML
jgi:hypothetical protein